MRQALLGTQVLSRVRVSAPEPCPSPSRWCDALHGGQWEPPNCPLLFKTVWKEGFLSRSSYSRQNRPVSSMAVLASSGCVTGHRSLGGDKQRRCISSSSGGWEPKVQGPLPGEGPAVVPGRGREGQDGLDWLLGHSCPVTMDHSLLRSVRQPW